MAQLNTEEQEPAEPTDDHVEQKVQAIADLLSNLDIEGVLVFRFPGDENSWRHIRRGHFYDTLQMVGEYVREAKKRISKDLDGIA